MALLCKATVLLDFEFTSMVELTVALQQAGGGPHARVIYHVPQVPRQPLAVLRTVPNCQHSRLPIRFPNILAFMFLWGSARSDDMEPSSTWCSTANHRRSPTVRSDEILLRGTTRKKGRAAYLHTYPSPCRSKLHSGFSQRLTQPLCCGQLFTAWRRGSSQNDVSATRVRP